MPRNALVTRAILAGARARNATTDRAFSPRSTPRRRGFGAWSARVTALRRLAIGVGGTSLGGALLSRVYDVATWATVRLLQGDRDVLGVYVRTKGRGACRPGLSDLDLTIVVPAAESRASFERARRLHRRCRMARRWLPMLGEVEILSRSAFLDALRFGPAVWSSIKTYVAVFERESPSRCAAGGGAGAGRRWRRAVRREAVLRYVQYVQPWALRHELGPTAITRHKLAHAQRQMARRLEAVGLPVALASDPSANLHPLFRALGPEDDRRAATTVPAPERPSTLAPPRVVRFARALVERLDGYEPLTPTVVTWRTHGSAATWATAVIAGDALDGLELRRVGRAFAAALEAADATAASEAADVAVQLPMLLSSRGWQAFLQAHPFESAALAASGSTLVGRLPPLPAPRGDELLDFIGCEYALLLAQQHALADRPDLHELRQARDALRRMELYVAHLRAEASDAAALQPSAMASPEELHGLFHGGLERLRSALVAAGAAGEAP
jgi:hypothetical protein